MKQQRKMIHSPFKVQVCAVGAGEWFIALNRLSHTSLITILTISTSTPPSVNRHLYALNVHLRAPFKRTMNNKAVTL